MVIGSEISMLASMTAASISASVSTGTMVSVGTTTGSPGPDTSESVTSSLATSRSTPKPTAGYTGWATPPSTTTPPGLDGCPITMESQVSKISVSASGSAEPTRGTLAVEKV